jgi:hypothetical protein
MFRHTAIATHDLDLLERFYCSWLSMYRYDQFEIEESLALRLTGGWSSRIRLRKLAFPSGGSIELIEYKPSTKIGILESICESTGASASQVKPFGIGISHIAVGSMDIEAHLDQCSQLGGTLVSHASINNDLGCVYCLDPERNLIELVDLNRKRR